MNSANAADLFDQVSDLQAKAQTPEEFVAKLPVEFRRNFTFVHTSRSPHSPEISYLHPRLILFSDDARVVLAINSDDKKPGHAVIEAIHFIDKEQRFEFRAAVLGKNQDSPFRHLVGENWHANPPSCLRCHGEDPRPIFDSYPLWPGFYGSAEDTFPKTDHGPKELAQFKEFLKKESKRGVFKTLIWPQGTTTPPFIDPKKHNSKAIVGDLNNFKLMPNTRLGAALTELNRERISRQILQSENLEKMREALLSGLLRCTRLPISKDFKARVDREMESENRARLFRMGIDPDTPHDHRHDLQELSFSNNLAATEYLVQQLSIERKDWSLAFEPNSFSFFDGILSSEFQNQIYYVREDWIFILLRDLAQKDSRFEKFFTIRDAYGGLGIPFGHRLDLENAFKACDLLDEIAAQKKVKLTDLPSKQVVLGPGEFVRPEVGSAAVASGLNRCVKCHDSTEAYLHFRPIPFAHKEALRNALGNPSASSKRKLVEEILYRIQSPGDDRMPPPYSTEKILNPNELQDVKKALQSLVSGESPSRSF